MSHSESPSNLRLALLAPRLPVRSETFVFREAAALEELGHEVLPFALRASDALTDEAAALAARTQVLYGGSAALIGDLLRGLVSKPARSFAVVLLGLCDAARGRFASARQRLLAPAQALAAIALGVRLERSGATHLHVHFAHSAATVGMYAARWSGLGLSIVGHARDLFVEGSLLREKVARADSFATISEAARLRLAREARVDTARIHVAPCGVDVERFRPDGGGPVAGRIVAVGRLVEKKGFDVLLEALARVSEPSELVIAGDGPERERLAALARRCGLDGRVRFAGALEGEAVLELLRTAEVFALPSRRAADGDADGLPVALIEAMAVEVPVVSTRLEGIPELIEDGVHGRLVEPGDVDALGDALAELVCDPRRARHMGRAARRRVECERDQRLLALRTLRRLAGEPPLPPPARTQAAEPPIGQRVVLITPARDEAEHLPRLAASLLASSLRPLEWVIVDDGSSDATPAIALRLAEQHPWIRVIERGDRGRRKLGGGVIETFDAGYASVRAEHDFVAKLDADLSFESCYLERLLSEFERDPRLGSASGKVFRPEPRGLVEEFMIDAMVAGQFKLYRRECFEAIGGFVREVMWDGIDFHRARQAGWRTRSFAAPELRLVHHRLMGSSDRSVYRGRLRWGRGQWFMGSHPLYLVASAGLRMLERPRLVGGLLIVAGYLGAALGRAPRYADRAFRRELRRWQLARLGRLVGGGQVR